MHGVEQLAEIAEPPRLGELLEGPRRAVVVDVAQGDDVLAGELSRFSPPWPPQPTIARFSLSAAERIRARGPARPEPGRDGPRRGEVPEELAAVR